jgi:hypothetical protein
MSCTSQSETFSQNRLRPDKVSDVVLSVNSLTIDFFKSLEAVYVVHPIVFTRMCAPKGDFPRRGSKLIDQILAKISQILAN